MWANRLAVVIIAVVLLIVFMTLALAWIEARRHPFRQTMWECVPPKVGVYKVDCRLGRAR